VFEAALLWWGVRTSGARVDLRWPRLTPEIKLLISLAIPGAFAASATQINILISGFLASNVAGGRSWLATADRLYQLPLGLVGVAVGVALLPRLSTTVQSGDHAGAQEAMDEAMALSLVFSLPAAAALIGMPLFLIDALYGRGEFLPVDVSHTASALFWYGWGTPAFVLNRILNQAFFARQDTRSPMRYALISVAVNIVAGVILFQFMSISGIAAATAIAAWLNVFQMVRALVSRGHYAPSAAAISRLGRILLASVALGVMLYGAQLLRPVYQPWLLHRKEIAMAAAVAVGGAAYLALLFGVRAVTLTEIRQSLRRSPKSTNAIADNTP
jgi:putative peptidoglycan lipid II flippase